MKLAMEHSSEGARKKYLKDHPKADPKNHTVGKGKTKSKSETKDANPKRPSLDPVYKGKDVTKLNQTQHNNIVKKLTQRPKAELEKSLHLLEIESDQAKDKKDVEALSLKTQHFETALKRQKSASITPEILLQEIERVQKLASTRAPSRKVLAEELRKIAEGLYTEDCTVKLANNIDSRKIVEGLILAYEIGTGDLSVDTVEDAVNKLKIAETEIKYLLSKPISFASHPKIYFLNLASNLAQFAYAIGVYDKNY